MTMGPIGGQGVCPPEGIYPARSPSSSGREQGLPAGTSRSDAGSGGAGQEQDSPPYRAAQPAQGSVPTGEGVLPHGMSKSLLSSVPLNGGCGGMVYAAGTPLRPGREEGGAGTGPGWRSERRWGQGWSPCEHCQAPRPTRGVRALGSPWLPPHPSPASEGGPTGHSWWVTWETKLTLWAQEPSGISPRKSPGGCQGTEAARSQSKRWAQSRLWLQMCSQAPAPHFPPAGSS